MLKCTCGKTVEIISAGEYNLHAGPDFIGARIKISSLTWIGNVELHVRGSDWEKHGHHLDPAYENVILHVVTEEAVQVYTSSGRSIPVLLLDIPEHMILHHNHIYSNQNWLACHPFILTLPERKFQAWLTRLQEERQAGKTGRIIHYLRNKPCSMEETLHLAVASALGLPANKLPMEMTLSSIPFSLLMESRDSVIDLEAMLYGQSGLLGPWINRNNYPGHLYQRFLQLQNSMLRPPLQSHLWKFLRLRPSSFPTLRLAQLASLINQRYPLFNTIIDTGSRWELEQLLRVKAGEYWDTHYLFGKRSSESKKFIGEQSVNHVILNAIIPFLLSIGQRTSSNKCLQLASYLLSNLKAESNSLIRDWVSYGIKPQNAFESQALLQLYQEYCKKKRCLDCMIGRMLMESGTKKARR